MKKGGKFFDYLNMNYVAVSEGEKPNLSIYNPDDPGMIGTE